jgi:Tfp pilus assembly protein PilF
MRESSWEGAEEHLKRAIAADPTVVLFHLDLGETYQLQGKTDQARAAFQAGLKVPDLYPTDRKFKETIVRRLEALGR